MKADLADLFARAEQLLLDALAHLRTLFSDQLSAAGSRMSQFVQAVAAVNGTTPDEAVRLAKEATFGPDMPTIDAISRQGIENWIDTQLNTGGSSYADLALNPVRRGFCDTSSDANCWTKNFTREPVAMRFYANAIHAPDQLRQRVAYALSNILVASTTEVPSAAGAAAYQQILLEHAFGNYRDLIGAVAMSGFMGDYLDMADSSKAVPSENFARELLQRFTMGVSQLQMDGTVVRGATGDPVPNFTPDDVRALARALTGWTFTRLPGAAANDQQALDYTKPMIAVPALYDTGEKRFLGVTVPAGASQQDSVKLVLDTAFNNPSTPPFVAKQLIQALVKANPTPGYVARVAAVFVNDGSGVRGNLKAVVRAILMDSEARGHAATDSGAGRLKDPILAMTSLARGIGFATDGFALVQRDQALMHKALEYPSVFGFYPADYRLGPNSDLVNPAGKLLTASTAVLIHNMVADYTLWASNRPEFSNNPHQYEDFRGSRLIWSPWETFGDDVDRMIDMADLIFLGNSMTAEQRRLVRVAAMAVSDTDPAARARKRAQRIIYILASSPAFLVDR